MLMSISQWVVGYGQKGSMKNKMENSASFHYTLLDFNTAR